MVEAAAVEVGARTHCWGAEVEEGLIRRCVIGRRIVLFFRGCGYVDGCIRMVWQLVLLEHSLPTGNSYAETIVLAYCPKHFRPFTRRGVSWRSRVVGGS